MGRPATGSIETRGSAYRASIPAAPGSKQRIGHTFTNEADARRWLEDANAARRDGRPIPDPKAYEGIYQRTLRPARRAVREPSPFSSVALTWWHEQYVLTERAGIERTEYVKDAITRTIGPFLDRSGDIASITRNDVLALVRVLSGRDDHRNVDTGGSDGPVSARLLTIAEAAEKLGVSHSTAKRYWLDGKFPNATKDASKGPQDRVRIPTGDVLAIARSRKQEETRTALARSTVNELLRIVNGVFVYAQGEGMLSGNPAAGVKALKPIPAKAIRAPEQTDPEALDLATSRRIAERLAPHHQAAFWLQRIGGLRISEVFGLHLDDVVDLGDAGLLFVRRQGGKPFWIHDEHGEPVRVTEKETTKTAASRRVLAIPGSLLEVLRVLLDAYHVEEDGEPVDPGARLIPDLTGTGTGQATYTSALRTALSREGLTYERLGYHVSSHSLRKSLSSELRWTLQVDEMVRSRLLGHRMQAFDGGSPTTARNYTQRMPQLAPLVAVAEALDASVNAEIGTLLVPTTAFGHVRWQEPFLGRAERIENVLVAAGWLRTSDEDEYALQEAAEILGIQRTTLNRWINTGRARARLHQEEGRHTKWVLSGEEIERLRRIENDTVTLANAARELGCGHQELWKLVTSGRVAGLRDGSSGDWRIERSVLEALKPDFEARRRLYERAMPIVEAARLLGISVMAVNHRIKHGRLQVDPQRDGRRRLVTRASVEDALGERPGLRVMKGRENSDGDVVLASDAMPETGLTRIELLALCRSGVLVRRDKGIRFALERESYERWLRHRTRTS
jgi:predicted site-specific integrase-resolvase